MKFFLLTYRSNWDEARPRERLGRDCFLPIGQSSLFIPECIRIWSHGLVNLSIRLCMCNLRGLHSLRERFETEFHTPGSMGAGEYGLTRGTCFVTRRIDAAAVAELLWTYWCVWVRRDFVFISLIYSLRRHTAFCKYRAFLTHLPLY